MYRWSHDTSISTYLPRERTFEKPISLVEDSTSHLPVAGRKFHIFVRRQLSHLWQVHRAVIVVVHKGEIVRVDELLTPEEEREDVERRDDHLDADDVVGRLLRKGGQTRTERTRFERSFHSRCLVALKTSRRQVDIDFIYLLHVWMKAS